MPLDFVPTMTTVPSLRGVSCRLGQEHGWSFSPLVRPCGSECPDRILGWPYSILACGCPPWRSSGWYREAWGGRALPIGFLVSVLPVLGSSSSCRLATQWIASSVLLCRTGISIVGKRVMEMRGSDRNAEIAPSICLPGIRAQTMMERMSRTF